MEFMIVFPFMVLIFALLVQFGAIFWGYQSAVAGVRDAARYVARSSDVALCVAGGSIAGKSTLARGMIETDRAGNSVLPGNMTVSSVAVSHRCVTGSYRTSPMAIAEVRAVFTVQMPLGGLFGVFGNGLTAFQTTVTDEQRVIGQ